MSQFGTPKDIPELVGQLATLPNRDLKRLGGMMIRDYLAQKFGVAMLQNTQADQIMKALFDEMTEGFSNEPTLRCYGCMQMFPISEASYLHSGGDESYCKACHLKLMTPR